MVEAIDRDKDVKKKRPFVNKKRDIVVCIIYTHKIISYKILVLIVSDNLPASLMAELSST